MFHCLHNYALLHVMVSVYFAKGTIYFKIDEIL